MKKQVYYLETVLPTTRDRLEEYLKAHDLYGGVLYKYPFAPTKLFSYIRTKPMSWWQLNKMAFVFSYRRARYKMDSEVKIYKAAS